MRQDDALEMLLQLLDQTAPAVGDRIPPERELAERIGCSRQTIRAAMHRLRAQGQVWQHVGKGSFRGNAPVAQPVQEAVLIDVTSPADLMEARLLLEPQIAAKAALVATPDDLRHLRRCLDAGRAAQGRHDCEQQDSAFHHAIARAAGNPVLAGVLRHLSDARRRLPWQREWDRIYRRIGEQEFRGLHSDQHQQIVDAIAGRDGPRARDLMHAHLQTIATAMHLPPPAPSGGRGN